MLWSHTENSNASPPFIHATSGKLKDVSEPRFLHLWNGGMDCTTFPKIDVGKKNINHIILIKKCSINIRWWWYLLRKVKWKVSSRIRVCYTFYNDDLGTLQQFGSWIFSLILLPTLQNCVMVQFTGRLEISFLKNQW